MTNVVRIYCGRQEIRPPCRPVRVMAGAGNMRKEPAGFFRKPMIWHENRATLRRDPFRGIK
ncbi:hypothetical protein NJLHNGOC_06875 [Novacetimonas cocois]|uniref:Uncharacterized protein n=1 Tax=Novacetimonas cocois TaxID=1747507 RepID=A0A365YY13_9PROT|nr:hypothetical protein NJLHNGOC_06875 [Novacetimonas cocois]